MNIEYLHLQNKNKELIQENMSLKEQIKNLIDKCYNNKQTKLESEINIKDKKLNLLMNDIANYDKNNLMSLKLNSPKYIKSHKNLGIKRSTANNKIIHNIILIQSVTKGFLFRMRWKQFFTFYKRVKRSIIILQKILFQKMKKHTIRFKK